MAVHSPIIHPKVNVRRVVQGTRKINAFLRSKLRNRLDITLRIMQTSLLILIPHSNQRRLHTRKRSRTRFRSRLRNHRPIKTSSSRNRPQQ